jgi:hypothetical protein
VEVYSSSDPVFYLGATDVDLDGVVDFLRYDFDSVANAICLHLRSTRGDTALGSVPLVDPRFGPDFWVPLRCPNYQRLALYDWNSGYGGRILAVDLTPTGQGPIQGTACTNNGATPTIAIRRTPTGSRLHLAHALPGAAAILVASAASQSSWNGQPLPIALDPVGFPGCQLLVAPIASALAVTGTTGFDRGFAAVDVARPLTAAATGRQFAAQWLVLEPGSGDWQTTSKHVVRLQ